MVQRRRGVQVSGDCRLGWRDPARARRVYKWRCSLAGKAKIRAQAGSRGEDDSPGGDEEVGLIERGAPAPASGLVVDPSLPS